MKNAGRYLTGALLGALVLAAPLQGQQVRPGGWRDLLQARIRVAYRTTHPDPAMECGAPNLPASGFLIAPENSRPVGRTWLAGPNQSTWEAFSGPSVPDTLAVKIVSIWCGAQGRSVLVESDGYFLEVNGDQLATVDDIGEVKPGILATTGSGSTLAQLKLDSACAPDRCVYVLADADAAALRVRTDIAMSLEAQRREWEDAQKSLQSSPQVTPMRAQTSGIGGQNLLVALQRYGASAEQASAIMQRKVLLGMTQPMVRAAIGEPERTSEQNSPQGVTIVWSYPNRQVNFRSGLVTEIR